VNTKVERGSRGTVGINEQVRKEKEHSLLLAFS